jgi:hypothetical protein
MNQHPNLQEFFMKSGKKISPAFLMNKLKMTYEMANKTHLDILYARSKEWFYIRNFGVNTEQFNRGDFLNFHKNIVEPR